MLKDCLVTFHNGGFIETGNIDSVNLIIQKWTKLTCISVKLGRKV